MPIKPRYKRRLIWTSVITVVTLGLAVIIVPPMITLNYLKPKIQQTIFDQTGIESQIRGDVHFSLLGGTTIVAHDIVIPIGTVDGAMFTVPFSSIFNMGDAKLNGAVSVYGANVTLDSIAPHNFNHAININDSTVHFHGHDFSIVRATLQNGHLIGTVRTDSHKYDVDVDGTEFLITNQNENLRIMGNLYDDGTARGRLAIKTDDINDFFKFKTPEIDATVDLTTNFEWNGGTGFKFTDIVGDNFAGNIELLPNGDKNIELSSPDLTYDFTFLANPTNVKHNTNLKLDFYGDLTFGPQHFKHLKINAISTPQKFQIANIVADDFTITGGYIDNSGAHNMMIMLPYDGTTAMCIFSGTPDNWSCTAFTYNNMSGSLRVTPSSFEMTIQSDTLMPNRTEFLKRLSRFGKTGHVTFQFQDIGGTFDITPDGVTSKYSYAYNKTLQWANIGMSFLPESMLTAPGNITQSNNTIRFQPNNDRWTLDMTGNQFIITGKNFKEWFPGIDLQSLKDLDFSISGTIGRRTISDLIIQIAGHEFSGTIADGAITLHTEILNINSFISPDFIDNFTELEFLTAHPITVPFNMNLRLALSANKLVYDGETFANFVYSLKDNLQIFSITDSARGSILAMISRDGSKYDISLQMNRFKTTGNILNNTMPLNVRDGTITAEITMTTSGLIAHDFDYNMAGDIKMTIEDGYLIGIGFDQFYASANDITSFNAEYALATALDSGETQIKDLRIVGKYENGDFITSAPIALRMPHVDATGAMDISDGQMMVVLNMILRGTSPAPQPIELRILPDGARSYSLTEIMRNFDAGFMRGFIRTHTRF